LGVFCLLAVIVLVALSLVRTHPLLWQARQLSLLPLIFAAFTAYFFCTSPAAFIALDPLHDVAGRYATPLMLALPFFFATTFVIISMCLHEYRKKSAQNASSEQNALQTSSSHRHLGRLAQGALMAVLLAGLYAQATTYVLADQDLTFLSPYCSKAPANIDPIITYLQHEHIHYVWTSGWIGYPMAFKTQESIVFGDPRYFITGLGLNRLPAEYNAVVHADRPALLAFVKHNDSHPQLLKVLDTMHITYRSMRFPAEQGFDILAIIPLNRSIPLRGSKSFAPIFYPTCNQIT
jgi:hypothetical protein